LRFPLPEIPSRRGRRGKEGEREEKRVEEKRRASPTRKNFFLPLRSANLPKGRRRAAELRRKEVLTQPRRTASTWNSL